MSVEMEMDLPELSEENIEKLSHLLDEWKLKFMLPLFIAEKIDLEVLEIIDVSHVNMLLHNYPIGVQIRFVHNLIAWRKHHGMPLNEKAFDEVVTTRNSTEVRAASQASTAVCGTIKSKIHRQSNAKSNKDSSAKTIPSHMVVGNAKPQLRSLKIDLKQILMNSPPNGPDLIELYGKQEQHFTQLDRKRLMSTIVNYFLECKIPLNLQISYELENAIVQLFPSESLQKYRNSRYGKIYLLYLREKTEQAESEIFSEIEESPENLTHDSDDGNVSNSLMCDLYDKENADEGCDDDDDDDIAATEKLDHENSANISFNFLHSPAEKIDLEVLEIIDVSHVNMLLHNYPIGVQIRFVHNLIAWRKHHGMPLNEKAFDEVVTTRNSTEVRAASQASTAVCGTIKSKIHRQSNAKSNKDSSAKTIPSHMVVGNAKPQLRSLKIDLKQILMNSPPNGPDLIELYGKQEQHFTQLDRKRLMSTIVNYFLECKIPLNLQISYELENAIVQLFPSESLQKYRNSRYGKIYLLYLREKTEQAESEIFSEIEESPENLTHDSDDGNVSNSLMCDLYDKENADEGCDDDDDDDIAATEKLDHDIFIQTTYEEHKKFSKARPPYQYSEFLASARTIFNIPHIDNICLYYKDLQIDELNFKSIILQNYKSITFTVQLKQRSETKECPANSNILPDAKFIRNITNLLPYAKLSDKGKPLQNSHRTIIAKTIIEECLRSNSERILKRQDFLTLADNICKAFHTEVPSTYFIPCRDSQPARGKLLNAYNNKRYTLSALGHLERRPRGTTRKRKRYTYAEDKSPNDKASKLRQIVSKEFSTDTNLDIDKLLQRWQESHALRHKELADGLKANEYLGKYSVLKTIRGIDLVEIDVKILHPKVASVDNWLTLYEMLVDKVRNIRNFRNVQKTLEAIDNSKDNRYRASLALNLLVYIFPYTWRFSKAEVQERFLREYKTMEDLKSDGEPADLQIRFVHQSQQIVYADFCVCGFIFKCVDLLEALTYLFYYIMALKLSYPRMCLRIWQFVQLAIFKVDIEDVMLPQIECTINDLLHKEKN